MARVVIAYAHAPGKPQRRVPLAVLVQDEEALVLTGVPQDVVALARHLGVPSQTYVSWVSACQSTLQPMQVPAPGQGMMETLPVTDPRWLVRFVGLGHADTFTYGPVSEMAGSAGDIARRLAQELTAQALP